MARLIDNVVGHSSRIRPLLEAIGKDRLASTLLFAGPSGIGKRFIARALAQVLICERGEAGACGECGSCLRIERGVSESIMLVEPDGASIKIEQARDILQFISLRRIGRARVVIIDQAHLLNPQAANSLLKSLEEPPDGTYFFLVTSVPASILATIRSRSQQVRFGPLSADELTHILTRISARMPIEAPAPTSGPGRKKTSIAESAPVDASSMKWVVDMAGGSIEMAERLLAGREEFQELEDAVGAYLMACGTRLPVEESARLKELTKDRQTQAFVAGWIEGLIRDAFRVRAGLNPVGQKLWQSAGGAFAALSSEALSDLATQAFALESEMARNIDRGLLFEVFAIRTKQHVEGRVL